MTKTHDPKLRSEPGPLPTCGAKTRKGTSCLKPAGFKTDHVGQGKCNLHGGRTPIKHGRYSKIVRVRIKELVELHADDPDPLDVLPELALARAALTDFLERYDEITEALLAWHSSWGPQNRRLAEDKREALYAALNELEEVLRIGRSGEATPKQQDTLKKAREAVADLDQEVAAKPRQVLDISDAVTQAAEVTKIVERIHKIRAMNAITYEQVKKFLFGIDRVLAARVSDATLLSQIQGDILAIPVT